METPSWDPRKGTEATVVLWVLERLVTRVKMPRGFVYYIAADSDPDKRMYIGSSMQTPAKRKAGHRCYKDTTASLLLNFADWDLHVIEWYELEGTREEARKELRQYEQRWIEMFRVDCVNKLNASGRDEQRIKSYQKQYSASEAGKVARAKHMASETAKETTRKYRESDACKASQHRRSAKYRSSEQGKAATKKYKASKECKATQRKYWESAKGQAARKRATERRKKKQKEQAIE